MRLTIMIIFAIALCIGYWIVAQEVSDIVMDIQEKHIQQLTIK